MRPLIYEPVIVAATAETLFNGRTRDHAHHIVIAFGTMTFNSFLDFFFKVVNSFSC